MDEYPRVPSVADGDREADADWPVLDIETVWETPYFRAGYDLVERPDGERAEYYWVEPDDAVVVVALAGDEVVLVEQYRPRTRARTLGLPAGAVDSGERPAAAARRELREEPGYRAETVTHLETYAPSGWLRYVRHVFVAESVRPGEQALDDGEFIDVSTVPADEAIETVSDRPGPTRGGALTPLLLARDAGYLRPDG